MNDEDYVFILVGLSVRMSACQQHYGWTDERIFIKLSGEIWYESQFGDVPFNPLDTGFFSKVCVCGGGCGGGGCGGGGGGGGGEGGGGCRVF